MAPEALIRLDTAFIERPTLIVARALIGCVVVSNLLDGVTTGRIVETEGYCGPTDPASHAAKTRRGRVSVMWGPPGIAYVYRSYGLHTMLNVVTESDGVAGAVLIRAVEPLTGIDVMRQRRRLESIRLLGSGPGRLCQALGITLEDQGVDLIDDDRLWIAAAAAAPAVSAGTRIGITRGIEHHWRFFETGSRWVSAHRRGEPLLDEGLTA